MGEEDLPAESAAAAEKQMKLRYAGRCRVCGRELPARAEAIYERATKTVRCLDGEHLAAPALDPGAEAPEEPGPESSAEPDAEDEAPDPAESGVAGSSARREYERRKAKREERIRSQHPKIGGFLLAVTDEPQSTRAWVQGAIGEELLGARLDSLVAEGIAVLHDRRIPGTRANIDHIVVAPTGVYVIDAKRYKGRPELRIEGGILRPRVERLFVGSRESTKLVDGVLKQRDVVRGVIGEDVPVRSVLCFVEADWPLLGGSFVTRDVWVLWPKKLYTKLAEPGALEPNDIAGLHQQLATALPPS